MHSRLTSEDDKGQEKKFKEPSHDGPMLQAHPHEENRNESSIALATSNA